MKIQLIFFILIWLFWRHLSKLFREKQLQSVCYFFTSNNVLHKCFDWLFTLSTVTIQSTSDWLLKPVIVTNVTARKTPPFWCQPYPIFQTNYRKNLLSKYQDNISVWHPNTQVPTQSCQKNISKIRLDFSSSMMLT